MVEVSFKSTTRTVNLLGRDNVLDYRSAILELVKNSYDAFSPRVDIRFIGEKRTDDKKEDILATSIEIVDYGRGMGLEKIVDVFFTLGTDDKTYTTLVNYQNLERTMNGSMGIGRLSLGRLGNRTTVITSNGETAYKFVIDWSLFSTGEPLDTIKVNVEELTLKEFSLEFLNRNLNNVESRGTILIAEELNDDWLLSDRLLVGTNYYFLKQTLNKLKNPLKLEKSGDFQIKLNYLGEEESIEPSITDISTDAEIIFSYSDDSDMLLLEGYLDEIDISRFPPDFVIAKFNELKPYIVDEKGKRRERYYFSKEYKISEYIPNDVPNTSIGDFDGAFYFTKKKGVGTNYPFIKGKITTNSIEIEPGILLYRDGFRIRPYGEIDTIGFDWLGIESIRVTNPAGVGRSNYLMQANQLSGYVNITKEKNGGFEDQSNREGIKKSKEFTYLSNVLLRIVKDFSSIRSELVALYNDFLKEKADVKYYSEAGKKTKRKLDKLIKKHEGNREKLFEDKEFKNLYSKPETLFELYSLQDTTEEENSALVTESDTLRTMATQGIVMSTFAHQIKNDKKFFKNLPRTLEDIGNHYSKQFCFDFQKFKVPYNLYKLSNVVIDKTANILGFIDSSVNNPTRDKTERINLADYIFKTYMWWDSSVRDNVNEYKYLINGKAELDLLSDDIRNIYVQASRTQLDSIFLNLITNSYKSFKEGKIRDRVINITVSMINEKTVEILYEDTGQGLSREIDHVDKIFEPYKKYPYKSNGTGMGMWILSSVVSKLKGSKEILSRIGERGFRMKIVLRGGNK